MNLRQIMRKCQAVAALMALLLAGVSALAESLSASDLQACCNTVYCPLHHRQIRDLQKDKSNCDAQGSPMAKDCSMRACDTMPSPVVEIAPYVLVAPIAILCQAIAESAPALAPRFVPFNLSVPLTPPPRTFPS